jgi:hypothetical protein
MNQKNTDKIDDETIKLLKIEAEFEDACDSIQKKTEEMLSKVPIHDKERRGKILDLHKDKLRKALQLLKTKIS